MFQEERQKRMVAADDSGNEDANTSEEDDEESSKQIRHISGDDLGDSFSHEAKPRTKVGWIDEILRRENASELESDDAASSGESEDDDDVDEEEAEGSDEDHGEDDKAQSLKDWEQSDDDNLETNLEEEEEEEDEDEDDDDGDDDDGDGDGDDSDDGIVKRVDMVDQKKISESRGKQKDNAGVSKVKTNVKEDFDKKGEFPYTIEAPKTVEEFSALLENCSDDQILEARRRIRTYNAITIAAENRRI